MLAKRLSVCIPAVLAFGLLTAAPARADELVDVAALEARIEAAVELAELPTEPDWGVQDLSTSVPAVTQDAPEVPPAPADVVEPAPAAEEPAPAAQEPAPEPRYQARTPQYHAEYQAPEGNPAPAPAPETASPSPAEAAPSAADLDPRPVAAATAAATPEAATPVAVQAPPQLQAPSAPTVWIWIWNWTWVQGNDDRYRNSDEQYQLEGSVLDPEMSEIFGKLGIQMPVQIGLQTGSDIATDIVSEISADELPAAVTPPVSAPALPIREYRVSPKPRRLELPRRTRLAPAPKQLEPVYAAPMDLRAAAPPRAASAPRRTTEVGKPPRARRASNRAPSLPVPAERLTDSAAASGASAGFLKTTAILALSLLLAAFGHARRIWLPAVRWRGLLGTRTDPPG